MSVDQANIRDQKLQVWAIDCDEPQTARENKGSSSAH
jgi:hypothetical protein